MHRPNERRVLAVFGRGCANVLAEERPAPCGATTYNTNLVEVDTPRHRSCVVCTGRRALVTYARGE